MNEVKIEIFGRVQGVNLRNTLKTFADGLGIKGYVQNKPAGSVFVVAQGEQNLLEQLIDWVKQSPGLSKVDKVTCEWRDTTKIFQEFRVQRDVGFIQDKGGSIHNLFRSMTEKQRAALRENPEEPLAIPRHVGIIMDGNRRWARERGLESVSGHYTSADYKHLISLFEEAQKLGIKYLSLWAFSTENWKRDPKEVKAIFDLVADGLDAMHKKIHENKICFKHIGRKDRIPEKVLSRIQKYERETQHYDQFTFLLFLDYGGRDEIVRTVNSFLHSKTSSVDETTFASRLDTTGIPDIDFIIRTSGEKRLSGFMPFQAVYAELYFTDVYFPDFGSEELREAITDFGMRKRRFGGN